MAIRTSTPPDLRRLCSLLTHWGDRSITEIAAGAGVDKSNLSRFVRISDSHGFSQSKLMAVLAELGWGSRGPLPSRTHVWTINDAADAEWLFGEVLGGQVELAGVYQREVDAARGELAEGVVIGKVGDNACLVLTKSLLTKSLDTVNTECILEILTDPRRGLARVRPGIVVLDRVLYARLRAGACTLEDVNAVLSGDVSKLESGGQDALTQMFESSRATWLGDAEGRSVLLDGCTRLARLEPDRLSKSLKRAWQAEYERTEGKRAATKLKKELARRAELETSKIAKRPYLLTWK